MQLTGLFHWGFVIYRCDYSNDATFDRFVSCLREHAEGYHQRAKQDRTTALYLRWMIVQDRERLDGATKEEVRERFGAWREERLSSLVEREREREGGEDDGGAAADHYRRRVMPLLPRFGWCIHVGSDSLMSLEEHEKAVACGKQAKPAASTPPPPPPPPVIFALVRAEPKLNGLLEGMELGDDDEEGDDECEQDLRDVCPAIEGSTEYDVGWMYVKAKNWVTLYEELHGDQAWYQLYTRPPAIVRF